jgi:hypothetical protein
MQQIVFINDEIPSGKLLINLLKEFKSHKKQDKVVTFLTADELEEMEDETLGKMMQEARTGEYVDKDKFLKKLKRK